ncbi:LysE family translocator [Paraburkholderia rhizosphaerae]|uniref:Threonine/homoserine/homoserine lactone efflux protein n=1 Tax=Paraburkholderia rhizosphaerae TaxID=480658 RepID=A0A4V3HCS0_9BURK|nr:LysE family transporter [Paraburkholderia rhizosphaerae]TDY38234.1 threonine/homoserine/homoserine lactone efflux protein [Paraburkholderia rhizosphaerae]
MVSNSSAVLFLTGIVVVLIMPGPTNTLLAAAGLRLGFRRAARLTGAELAGYLVSITLWGVSLAQVAHVSAVWPKLVRLGCCIYIAYLALRMWRSAVDLPSSSKWTIGVRTMFCTTLLNPKAILFAGTIFPAVAFQRVPAYFEAMAIFATVLVPIGIGWVAFGSALGSDRPMFVKIKPERVQQCASVVLATFSVLLAYSLFR